jgi:hypothetical protein
MLLWRAPCANNRTRLWNSEDNNGLEAGVAARLDLQRWYRRA